MVVGVVLLAVSLLLREALPGPTGLRPELQREPVQVATPTRGDATTVTACDYASLLGDPAELAKSGLSNLSMQQLDERVATFAENCPASK